MLGKAPGLELGEDELAVADDLEATSPRGDEGESAEVGLELLQDLRRQTDGLGFVPSHGAVFDTQLLELHDGPPDWGDRVGLG